MQRPNLQAPGLIWREMKDGWEARWQARTDLVRRGFLPKSVRIWAGQMPDELARAFITERAEQLQAEMLVWGRGGIPEAEGFSGSIPSLIRAYGTDPDSPYRKLRYKTRIYYDALCEAIED